MPITHIPGPVVDVDITVPGDKHEELLTRARKRFAAAEEAEKDIRLEAELDLKFVCGDQWDPKVKRDRDLANRPALVFNKLQTPVQQLANQARQNKPAIRVNPVDSAADVDTAKVFQGMIRHIEYDSDADQAYDTALEYAASCSFGYWRYSKEYTSEESFDQDIKTVRVDDPFTVYLDTDARKPDRSDMMWAFVIDKMSKDCFKLRFGKEPNVLSEDFQTELAEEGWIDGEDVRIAEYWEVELKKRTLRLQRYEDGTIHPIYTDEIEGDDNGVDFVTDDDGQPQEREVQERHVTQYIINGAEVLETNPWDGKWIPIVPVWGKELIVKGKRCLFSLVRFARDPQQLHNFYKTMEAETISLAPKPKWVGAVGQFKTKKRDWQRANSDNAAYLEYDPVAVGDKIAPAPQWVTFDPPVQALNIGSLSTADDIKAATGYFDPSLGEQRGDSSGIAINRLQKQGDVSNFHFIDNLARAQKQAGRILLDLIPKTYDTAREVRIIGDDEKQRVIKVNAPYKDEDGKVKHHKLDVGRYDVTITTGPSYTTQRQEAFELLTQLAQNNPQVMQIGGDIIWENSDVPGADLLAKRWKKTLPPNLVTDENQPEVPPQVQAQLAQSQQVIQVLNGQVQKLAQLLSTQALKLESQERIATENNIARIMAAEMAGKSAEAQQAAQLDHDAVMAGLNRRAQLLDTLISIQQEMQQAQQAQQPPQPPAPQGAPATPQGAPPAGPQAAVTS
jgi:hypothetical protein